MKKALLLLALTIGISNFLFSSHAVGGDIHYRQTGPNSYDVVMTLFRYCEPGAATLANNYSISVLDQLTCNQITTVNVVRDTFYPIAFGDECYTPIGLCVETHIYRGSIAFLANNPNGYMSTWSLCCRNNVINVNANNLGLYTKFPDPALAGGNSTPIFVDYPTDGYFCIGNDKVIDFSASDLDGDSLAYFLANPINTFTRCTPNLLGWQTSHNLANILGPGSSTTIDSRTGLVTARPAALGTYVISVRVEEYRNGIKIGETIRDIQYRSLNCTYDLPPRFDIAEDTITFIFDKTDSCFDIYARDLDNTDTFYLQLSSNTFAVGATASVSPSNTYTWRSAVTGAVSTSNVIPVTELPGNLFEGVGEVGARICWNPTECEILTEDNYFLDVYGFSIGCSGNSDSIAKRIPIVVKKPSEQNYVVPNVFSPNGDGVNDLFFMKEEIYDKCYDALTIRIYNRWGQEVFMSDDPLFSWDGKDQSGAEVAEGTYYVILQGYYGTREVTQNYPVTLFR